MAIKRMIASSFIYAFLLLGVSVDIAFSATPLQIFMIKGDGTKVIEPDTVILQYPDDALSLCLMIYDRYGNLVGTQLANWFTSGTLRPLDHPDTTSRILYDASLSLGDEEGYITAGSLDPNLSISYGSIYVKVVHRSAVERPVINHSYVEIKSSNRIHDLLGRDIILPKFKMANIRLLSGRRR